MLAFFPARALLGLAGDLLGVAVGFKHCDGISRRRGPVTKPVIEAHDPVFDMLSEVTVFHAGLLTLGHQVCECVVVCGNDEERPGGANEANDGACERESLPRVCATK